MTDPHDDFLHRLRDAALAAERETGDREASDDDARRSMLHRIARGTLGTVIVVLGVAALPLPGPGWLIIIVGLTLLPFAWAERTVRLIRRKVPGVPEEGGIPARTWLVMGALVALATASSLMWGDDLAGAVRDIL